MISLCSVFPFSVLFDRFGMAVRTLFYLKRIDERLSRLSKKTCAWHRTMLRFCYRRKRKVGTFCQVPKKRSSKRTSSCVVGSSWRFVCSSEGKRRHKPPSHRLRFPTDESYFLPFSRQENYITKSVVASNHVQTSIFSIFIYPSDMSS